MAVTGVLKKCADCGTVFVAENPASKYCPCCSARRNIPGPARGNSSCARMTRAIKNSRKSTKADS